MMQVKKCDLEQTSNPMPEQDKPDVNISPAPTEVTSDSLTDKQAPSKPASSAGGKVPAVGPPAEPLSDGTVPTVLSAGNTHRSVAKGKASITSIYRRADIMTTLITLGGAIVAAVIILGVYAYVTRGKTPAKNTAQPKVTSLSSSDLSKLNDFFGGNTAGNPAEVLTVNSSSLFDGRVAVNSDLKVVGGEDVSGSTNLAALTVNNTSTLGVTNIRGQLTVAGPTSIQGATILANGLTVTGNVSSTGNGSFGGSLASGTINAGTLNVASGFNLSSHLNTVGSGPTISSGTIGGTDTTGNFTTGGGDVTVTFHTGYTKVPIVILTPTADCPDSGQFYVQATGGTGFIVTNPAKCPSFNYWVSQ